ncbi:MAG TPA: hypothetical protein VJS65_16575 [Verrucomicrobiae bacterium]|nr:hypothetical protein [Verrucomicrobiae bacterium]
MKFTTCSPSLLFAVLFPFLSIAATTTQAAESEGPQATVTGLLGLAQVAHAGSPYAAVKVGTVLKIGDQIQTANGSAVDLSFGKSIGTVRLLQSTTLEVNALSSTVVDLNLKGGQLISKWKKQPAGSKFQVDVSAGIAGILEGEFRLDARGYLVLLEGTALFAETRGEGEPVLHTLKADKPVYFSPTEHAILPVPKELQREVSKQLKAKLPKG